MVPASKAAACAVAMSANRAASTATSVAWDASCAACCARSAANAAVAFVIAFVRSATANSAVAAATATIAASAASTTFVASVLARLAAWLTRAVDSDSGRAPAPSAVRDATMSPTSWRQENASLSLSDTCCKSCLAAAMDGHEMNFAKGKKGGHRRKGSRAQR